MATNENRFGLSNVRRSTWVRWAIVVGGVLGVVVFSALFGPDHPAVVKTLEKKYEVTSVEWRGGGRFQRDTIVVDGKDISKNCAITGAWFSAADAKIVCDTDVGAGEVK